VVDRSNDVLRRLSAQFGARLNTVFSTQLAVQELAKTADLLIGCVLIPGAAAPKLITKAMLKTMKAGAVIVDVAIDQGGCCETSRATTHDNPTYIVDDIVHYCVANMPGAVSRTSTFALNNATLPFILALADKGANQALLDDMHLANGLNVYNGNVTCKPVAEAHGLTHVSVERAVQNGK
jgi:alanine dehydrogenase